MIHLVTFQGEEGPRAGVAVDGEVRPLPGYASVREALQDWPGALAGLERSTQEPARDAALPGSGLLAPLPDPRNLYFAGANYRDHVEEMRRTLDLPLETDPKAQGRKPWFSIKATGASVVGPGAVVVPPGGSRMLDWEIELAVVIGMRAKDIPHARALDCVAGYTVANDLSARDCIAREGVADHSPFRWDWIGQKSFDGSCPMGPGIVPACHVADPMNLDMKLWVNGELMQDSNTSQMIFSIEDQIEFLSSRITLQPGDVILTGTPAGVGAARRRFLQPGDTVRQWIERIGEFEFSVAGA